MVLAKWRAFFGAGINDVCARRLANGVFVGMHFEQIFASKSRAPGFIDVIFGISAKSVFESLDSVFGIEMNPGNQRLPAIRGDFHAQGTIGSQGPRPRAFTSGECRAKRFVEP